MHPSVSVVIPTLNAASEIGRLIGALEVQSLKPVEILVVDSSSDDETVSIAREHGAKTHVIPREDFNHGTTRHEGLWHDDWRLRLLYDAGCRTRRRKPSR